MNTTTRTTKKMRLTSLLIAVWMVLLLGVSLSQMMPSQPPLPTLPSTRPSGDTVVTLNVKEGTMTDENDDDYDNKTVVSFENNVFTINQNPPGDGQDGYFILEGTSSENTVVVAEKAGTVGAPIYIVANGVNITDPAGKSPLWLQKDAFVTLDLEVDSKNTFVGGINSSDETSYPGIWVDGATLTVTAAELGEGGIVGELTATAKDQDNAAQIGAGIGAMGEQTNGANIIISGGTIIATGAHAKDTASSSAGIGAGNGQLGETTITVEITGGTVTAKGGTNAAGIGAGEKQKIGATVNVTISGGTVTATSQYGAGVGGGREQAGTVNATISAGGKVTATSADGAGIGGGRAQADGTVNATISGGKVTATSTEGAGVGGGRVQADGTVNATISGGTVTATSTEGAGVGGGRAQADGTVNATISGGEVDARATTGGTGIGQGKTAAQSSKVNINIKEQANVIAVGGTTADAQGIGTTGTTGSFALSIDEKATVWAAAKGEFNSTTRAIYETNDGNGTLVDASLTTGGQSAASRTIEIWNKADTPTQLHNIEMPANYAGFGFTGGSETNVPVFMEVNTGTASAPNWQWLTVVENLGASSKLGIWTAIESFPQSNRVIRDVKLTDPIFMEDGVAMPHLGDAAKTLWRSPITIDAGSVSNIVRTKANGIPINAYQATIKGSLLQHPGFSTRAKIYFRTANETDWTLMLDTTLGNPLLVNIGDNAFLDFVFMGLEPETTYFLRYEPVPPARPGRRIPNTPLRDDPPTVLGLYDGPKGIKGAGDSLENTGWWQKVSDDINFDTPPLIEVTYDLQGGEWHDRPEDVPRPYDPKDPYVKKVWDGDQVTALDPEPSYEGYEFLGWYTLPQNDDDAEKFDFDSAITRPTRIYARWKKIDHYVLFDPNGGHWGGATRDISRKTVQIDGDHHVFAPQPNPERDNHRFLGWFYEQEAPNTKWEPSDSMEPDTVLYAHWEENSSPPNSSDSPKNSDSGNSNSNNNNSGNNNSGNNNSGNNNSGNNNSGNSRSTDPTPTPSTPPNNSSPNHSPSKPEEERPPTASAIHPKPPFISVPPDESSRDDSSDDSTSDDSISDRANGVLSNSNGQGSGGATISSRTSTGNPATGDSALLFRILLMVVLFAGAGVVTLQLRRKASELD